MATVTQLARSWAVLELPEIRNRAASSDAAGKGGTAGKNLLLAGIRAILAKLLERLKSKNLTFSKLVLIFSAAETFYKEVSLILSDDDLS